MTEGLRLIKRIEFHEKKSRSLIMPYIETQFHVTDIIEFLKYCDAKGKISDWMWDYLSKKMEKMRAWKRPEPKHKFHFKGKIAYIYPKQNVVAVVECGLHYVCQHSFDILLYEDRQLFYGHFERNRACIGMLFGLDGSKRKVFTTDILCGFMLHREQIEEYGDSFVEWIKQRRIKDEN